MAGQDDEQPTRHFDAVNAKNIDHFIEKYGEAKAAIYLQAYQDFMQDLNPVLYFDVPGRGSFSDTDYKVRRKLRAFVEEKENLFELPLVKQIISKPPELDNV